jgi:hypothetical protein
MAAAAAAREPRAMNAQAVLTIRAARTGGLLLAAVALAGPANAAAAPTLKADLPCYYPGQRIALSGAGYTPAGDVGLMFQLSGARGNNIFAPKDALKADTAGGVTATMPAPDLASDNDLREQVSLTANDQARFGPNGPIGLPEDSFAETHFLLTDVDVLVKPWFSGRGNPRAMTTFKIVGWEPFRRVYAHYFLNGKRIRTVALGAVSGPCGDLTKKMRQFPFRPVPAGRYKVRFSGTRLFDPQGFWIGYRDVVVARTKAVQ